MSNVIPQRIADTLKKFPPFSLLDDENVVSIASESNVTVCVNGENIWEQGAKPEDVLRFLARGRVEYHWKHENEVELVDVRDVGDLLGLTALYDEKPYAVTAVTAEDCLFYEFEWRLIRSIFESNDLARNYIRRHLFWATRLGNTIHLPNQTQARVVGRSKNILQAHLDGAQRIHPRKSDRLLTCPPDTSIHQASILMIAKKVPSMIVVDEKSHPIGIITHRDMVKHIIVQGLDKKRPISEIMTKPLVTVESKSSSTAALLLMLQKRIGQVCVTEDGTDKSRLMDVCTEKDLLAQSGHHPAGLLREIRNRRSLKRLRELCDDIEKIIRSYLEASVSSVFVGQICAELYDELVQSLINMNLEKLEKQGFQLPKVQWSWIAVGSDGRREQLLRTDIDNAILFESTGKNDEDDYNRLQFIQIGRAVVEDLVQCGFAKCQGGVMALNPSWCRTTKEWEEEIRTLKKNQEPDKLLRAIIVFDMRQVSGDRDLFETMRSFVFEEISNSPMILKRIAESIVATPPPLSFLKKFVVEKKGRHEGEFDIKSRALTPIRGAAQLISFKYKLMRRYSTGGRWQDVQNYVQHLEEVAKYAEEAYEFLLRIRTINGLKRGDSGRFLEPASISRLERAQLAHSFDVVRMVQNAIRMEFQLENRI